MSISKPKSKGGSSAAPKGELVFLSSDSEVIVVRRSGKELASSLGFDDKAAEMIAIVCSELGTNLVKHAGKGTLRIEPIKEGGRVGILIESKDKGPGIRDAEGAIADGFSTAGSLGYGLGTVNRIMDELEIASSEASGTIVTGKMFIRDDELHSLKSPLDIGVASRQCPHMHVNGDAFIVKHWEGHTLVAVIDGVGHGQYAHRAAQSAKRYVEDHVRQSIEGIFSGTSRACRGTRGVVMSIVRFNWDAGTYAYGSIGNIEIKVFDTPETVNFLVRRGIIGSKHPSPNVIEHKWHKGSSMVLFSDGIISQWKWEDFLRYKRQKSTLIAQRMLKVLGRDNDDATIVVIKDEPKGI